MEIKDLLLGKDPCECSATEDQNCKLAEDEENDDDDDDPANDTDDNCKNYQIHKSV